MMKLLIITVSFSLSSLAFAEVLQDLVKSDQEIARLNKILADQQNGTERLRKAIEEYNNSLTVIERDNRLASVNEDVPSAEQLRGLRAQLNEAQTRSRIFKKETNESKRKPKEVEEALKLQDRSLKNINEGIKDREKVLERSVKLAETKIKALQNHQSLDEAQIDILTSQQQLDLLERAYDRGVIGRYVREKVAALLTTNALCKSIRECKDGVRSLEKSKIDNTDLQQIFPYSDPQWSSNYIDKGSK